MQIAAGIVIGILLSAFALGGSVIIFERREARRQREIIERRYESGE